MAIVYRRQARIFRARIFCGFLLLLSGAGAASLPDDAAADGASRDPAANRFENAEEAIAVYRDSITKAMNELSAVERNDKALPERLSRISTEIYPVLSWGRIGADGRMLASHSGSKSGIWGMVMDLNHPALQAGAPTLETGERDGVDVITIRPDLMSSRWAGIFMMHELSHALDQRATYPLQPECRAEFEAYVVEQQYYDLITDGRFIEALDRVIGAHGFVQPGDVAAAYAAEPAMLAGMLDLIESDLGEGKPLSKAEREMRDGFYYVSIVDRIGQRRGDSDLLRCDSMLDSMRPVSKY